MKKLPLYGQIASGIGIIMAVLLVVSVAQAATTIGTNIQTDGTLSVTGTTTLMQVAGIGTSTPTYGLDVQSGATGLPVARFCAGSSCANSIAISALTSPNKDFFEMHLSNWASGIGLYDHANAGYSAPFLNIYKSRGTQTAPTAITYTGYENDSMGGINFGGYDGSNYGIGAAIYSQNDEDWTSTSHEGHLSIYFTKHGQTTQNQMVQFGGKDSAGVDGTNVLFMWPLNFFSNSATGVHLSAGGAGDLRITRGDGTTGAKLGIGTTSAPVANLQVANGNATTTMEIGSANENKGSCMKLYRTDGSAIYAYVAAGATTFTLTTTPCANVTNF